MSSMNALISSLFSEQLIHAISLTILHSIWQGSLLALVVVGLLKRYMQWRAAQRHRVAMASLLLMLCISFFTFIFYFFQASGGGSSPSDLGIAASGHNAYYIHLLSDESQGLTGMIQENYHRIALTWLVGVLLFSLRVLGGSFYLASLKRSLQFEVPARLSGQFTRMVERLRIEDSIRLAVSDKVTVPFMLGHFKPIIVMPVAVINALSPQEVEAIFIHELAHIMRKDYIMNVFLMGMESLFFYHPAVWWISSIVKSERENACDEMALKIYPNRLNYAKTLVKLGELQEVKTPSFALSFLHNKKCLMKRIKRILNLDEKSNRLTEKLGVFVLLMAGLLTLTSASNLVSPDSGKEVQELSILETLSNVISTEADVSIEIDNDLSNDVDIQPEPVESISLNKGESKYDESGSTIVRINGNDVTKGLAKASIEGLPSIRRLIDDLKPLSRRDTIDDEESRERRRRLRAELREKRQEMNKIRKEVREKMKEARETYHREHRDEMKKLRQDIREKQRELRKVYRHKDRKEHRDRRHEKDHDDEGFGFEHWGEDWKLDLERLSEDMAHLSEELSIAFSSEHGDFAELAAELNSELQDMDFDHAFEFHSNLTNLNHDIGQMVRDAMSLADHDFDFDFSFGEDGEFMNLKDLLRHKGMLKSELIETLEKDGLINEEGHTVIELKDGVLMVNGEKQSEAMREKYAQLINDFGLSGSADDGNTTITIYKDKDKKNDKLSKINISMEH